MKYEVIECDLCNNKVPYVNRIKLAVTYRQMSRYDNDKIYECKDICDDCLVSLGFSAPKEANEGHKERQTLSERFKDIVMKFRGGK